MNLDDRLTDETWLERLREAEGPPASGRIGPYEVVSEFSRGGQGVVFRGRQPGTNRPVALKRLIGGRLAAGAARARFDREIDAVCALSHPHIVTVFGVETVDGQPVLAMEWIDGVPIDRWAREPGRAPRPIREVLDALLKVCDAVQHAHQRGVIHRDLKPSNILVDAAGAPHVLDFGLAKTTSADDSAAARLTLTEEFLGTPAFAAPEQVGEGHTSVDARADVYALGAVLYDLLTGRTPHDSSKGLAAMLVAIRERDPAAPSTLTPGLDRDLDTVTLKALARDPAQRYQSVDAFAADLQRYLAGEPVAAHPPSLTYQLRKMIRRHRLPFALVFGLVGLLASLAVVATTLAVRLEQERTEAVAAGEEARDARDAAEQVSGFLRDMLTAARPGESQGETITVSEVVDRAIARIDGRFTDQPIVEATIRLTLGETLRELGRHDDATEQLERALELYRNLHGEQHADVAVTLLNLGHTARADGRLDDCVRMYEQALDIYRDLPGRELKVLATLSSLATTMLEMGRHAEAEAMISESLELRAGLPDAPAIDRLHETLMLSSLQFHRGDFAAAEALLRPSLDEARAELGEAHELTHAMLANLAVAIKNQGRPADALPLAREVMDICNRLYGDRHPRTLLTQGNLASLLQAAGQLEESEALYRATAALCEEALGPDHQTTLSLLHNLASLLREQERYAEAEAMLRDVIERSERVMGRRHPSVAMALGLLADSVYAARGSAAVDEAAAYYREALSIMEETLPAGHPHIGRTRERLDRLAPPEPG